MPVANRAALIQRTAQVLQKHYRPILPPADRPLLEHLLYACCLENAAYDKADETFARLVEVYFDWNEIRVTTIAELCEALAALPEPAAAAQRLKRSLQSVFDAQYSFDLEKLKKDGLSKAVARLEKFAGVSPFGVAYVAQHALGGHSIPIDKAALGALQAVGVITPGEAAKGGVPGLERAISKNKGPEFASLLHQFAADHLAAPAAAKTRGLVLEINPQAAEPVARAAEEGPPRKAGGEKKPSRPLKAPPAAGEKAAPRKAPKPAAKPRPPEKKAAPPKPAGPEAEKKSATKGLAKKKPR